MNLIKKNRKKIKSRLFLIFCYSYLLNVYTFLIFLYNKKNVYFFFFFLNLPLIFFGLPRGNMPDFNIGDFQNNQILGTILPISNPNKIF